MQRFTRESMWQDECECYGCDAMTTNESGMCDECGGSDKDSKSMRPVRKTHTLREAYDIIEKEIL